MSQVINTNVASLNAQRSLHKSQSTLATSLQRLSSGKRINSAKDDAAGLAISERFTAQIRGLDQSVRNANDGISLAQTAEGALGEVTNNLQRIRELGVQSINATNSASDRAAMQQEVAQLVSEIDRVSAQTNFNGIGLLDGTFTSRAFQVGANVGDTIMLDSLVNSTKAGLGLTDSAASATSSAVAGALDAGDLTINGVAVAATARDAKLQAAAISNVATNVSATATTSVDTGSFGVTGGATSDTYTLTVAGVNIQATLTSATLSGAEMDTAFDTTAQNALTAAGVSWTGSFAGGDMTFTDDDGDNLVIGEAHSGGGSGGVTSGVGTNYGTVTVTSTDEDLVIGGTTASDAGLTAGTTTKSVNTLDVSTVAGANAIITAVDSALSTVNSSRAQLGAIQNRFESVVTNLQTSSESLSSARSRILDTDFAEETANLTRAQVLQQAGTAMLSQANSLPQNVMSLLQG